MSGSDSSDAEERAARIFEDLTEHERSRRHGSTTDVAPTADPADAVPAIARYEFRLKMGEGASAVVYAAWDRELRRPVAIKVLRQGHGLNELARLRFRREAQAAAGLVHPNVVTVHDAGESGGLHYIVMELVEGRSFADLLAAGNVPRRDVLHLLEQAARGVAAAHEKGIVHRDLKPANILVPTTGEPKVGDFGLAHLLDSESAVTRTGTALGTPLYMSPEQVDGRLANITPRADVYSLGAILFELLEGHPPHEAQTIPEIYRMILEEEPAFRSKTGIDAPEDLKTIALKALDKDPSRRYAHAAEFADDLRRAIGGERIVGRRAGRVVRLIRRSRRHPVTTAILAGAALAVAAVSVVATSRAREAASQFRSEREQSVELLRETARVSLQAALQLREKGETAAMRRYLPALERAYEGAKERDSQSAEIDYLMGRMHRALMDHDRALVFQNEALRKDPGYGPSLYEQAVLLSRKQGHDPLPSPDAIQGFRSSPMRSTITENLSGFLRRFGPAAQDLPPGLKEVNLLAARGILAHYQGKQEEARELLESAVRIDPLLDEAWDTLARVTAEQHRSTAQGDRERKWLEQEMAFTEAIRKDRGFLPHLLARGDLKRDRATDRGNRGENPLPDLKASEEDYSEAVRLNEQAQEAWMRRAMVRTVRGIYLAMRNGDPLGDYAEAEKDLAVVSRLSPAHDHPWTWKSMVRVLRGDHLASRGQDPLPEYARALEDARQSLNLNAQADGAHKRLGIAHVQRATWLLLAGRAATEDLKAAQELLAEAAIRQPGSFEVRLWKGILRLRTAQARIAGKEDPRADFAVAEEELTQSIQMKADYARAWMWRGQLKVHSTASERDPLPELARARDDLSEAIRLQRSLPDSWLWRGVIGARKASHLAANGQDPGQALIEAEEDISQALQLDPGYAEGWTQRGHLRRQKAGLLEKKGQPRLAAAEYEAAAESYRTALKVNPSLGLKELIEDAARRAREAGR